MKGDKKGEERFYSIYQLKGKQITQKTRKEMAGSDKGKLIPTDIEGYDEAILQELRAYR